MCFPNAPVELVGVMQMCVASVLYHREYLREKLPAHHPVFLSPLFADRNIGEKLCSLIVCGLPKPTYRIQPTGIPVLTTVLMKIHDLDGSVNKLAPAIETLAPRIVDGINTLLEQKAVGYDTVTRSGLKDMLAGVLEESGLLRLIGPSAGSISGAAGIKVQPA